ncbi:MAG: IS1182 family transposase [Candidatus Eisenbacteria bacterium]|nr:IS1182 family transposase [Candidatus Eisenbacteria bacterium]
MRYLQPAERTQFVLMNTLDDLVPPQHPVRIIDTVVEQIVAANHQEFASERDDSDPGRPAFAPQTMLKLFLYGYLINCRASRKLEAETKRNIELLWLLGTLSPDHWVIAHYRRVHGDQIKAVTKAFRQFLHAHGYIKGERVAIDGTKMKANAKREMLTVEKIEKRLHRLDEQLEEYLNKLAENDIRDDLAEELDCLDSSVAVDRYLLDKIIALQKQVEELTAHKATLENSEKAYLSPSDPDASLMKSRDGKVPAYNVQSVVDDAYHMIAATEVLTEQDDHAALPRMVEAVQKELGMTPNEITADKGYYTPDCLQQIETTTGATCYVPPPGKDRHASPVRFHYDASTDIYTCSAGRVLVLHQKNKRRNTSLANVYQGTQCADCDLRAQCTTSGHGRIVHRYHNQDWRDRFRERMEQASSKAVIALRKCLVEHPFGTIKLWGGKLPLLLRGVPKVTIEINLYATTYNLRRLFNCTTWETLTDQVTSHSWKLA